MNLFSYFSIKTCVVGVQKNRLNETVLLRTQNTMFNPLTALPSVLLFIKIAYHMPIPRVSLVINTS